MKVSNKLIVISQGVTTDEKDKLNTIFKVVNGFRFDIDFEAFKQATGSTIGESMNIFPGNHTLSSLWQLDKKTTKKITLNVETKLFDPSNKQLGDTLSSPLDVEIGSDNLWVHTISAGIPITTEGYYKYETSLKDGDTEIVSANYRFNIEINDVKPVQSS